MSCWHIDAEDPKSATLENGIASVNDVPGVKELDVDQVLAQLGAGRLGDVVGVSICPSS